VRPLERTGNTWRLGTVVALIAFAFALGAAFRSGPLLALAEALAAVTAGSFLACLLSVRRLEATRELDDRAFEDDAFRVRITVRNRGRLPAFLVEVHDRLLADPVPARAACLPDLGPGREATVAFEGRAARGRGTYGLGPIQLLASDPLGLFSFRRVVSAPARLVVLPRPLPLAGVELEARLGGALSGEGEQRRAGSTTNFLGLREYRPGEPVRRIHWRASARRDRLVVTEFEAPSHTDVAVLLDLDRGRLRGVGRGSNVEVAVRLAAALARHAIEAGHAVSLMAHADAPLFLPARSGRGHLIALLDALAQVQARGDLDYLDLVERALPLVPEGGRLVLIFGSARGDGARLADLAARWRRRGLRAAASVIDDRALLRRDGAVGADDARGDDLEEVLRRLGVPVLPVVGPAPAAAAADAAEAAA